MNTDTPFSREFPTLEAAVSALCEKVFGATPTFTENLIAAAEEPFPHGMGETPKPKFTETVSSLPLEHREFPPITFHDSGEATREIIDVLKIAEKSVNHAIREGADEVKLSYHNILDAVHNPDGCIGTVRTVGYRTGGDKPRFTVTEIADYLAGWQAADDQFAHHNALSQIQDDQDGIAAVVNRHPIKH